MAKKRTEDYLAELSSSDVYETFAPDSILPAEGVESSTTFASVNRIDLTPEAAADILLSKLEPSIRNYAIELADLVLKIPRWQLVLGSLMCQYQSGSLVAPYIDPSWQVQQIVESSSKCERCGETFVPKRLKQRFCCNECGSLAIRDALEKLERKGDSRANP
jgi:ribosomal protein S27AE